MNAANARKAPNICVLAAALCNDGVVVAQRRR